MARRSPMSGTIKRRVRDGRESFVVDLPLNHWRTASGGRRVRAHEYRVAATRREAERILEELRRKRDRGVDIAAGRATLETFTPRWLERLDVRRRTLETYETIARRHIIPYIGPRRMSELSTIDVEDWIQELGAAGELAPSSIGYALRVLRLILEDGVRLGILDTNVARNARAPRAPRRRRPGYTRDQARRILELAAGDRLEAFVSVGLGLGMRESEILGLTWSAVDLERGTLSVVNQLGRASGRWILEPPKTDSSVRVIALPAFVTDQLRRRRRAQLEEQLRAGPRWRNAMDLVFTTTRGTPIHRRTITRWFRELLALDPQIPQLGIHAMRHAAASILHAQGASPRDIQDVLGHADVRITLETYTHIGDDERRATAARMDAALGAGS